MPKKKQGWNKPIQTPVPFRSSAGPNPDWSIKATFHLTISMRGQCATAKYKGVITITVFAGTFLNVQNDVGVFCLYARDATITFLSASEFASVSILGGAEEKCIGTLMTDQFNSISIGRKVGWIRLSSTPVQPCIFNFHFKIQAGSPVTITKELIYRLSNLGFFISFQSP